MKRHSMAIFVSGNAVNFGKQKPDVRVKKIKEKCYSYKVVQKSAFTCYLKLKMTLLTSVLTYLKIFLFFFSIHISNQGKEKNNTNSIVQIVFQEAYLLFLIPFHKHNTSVDRPLTRISQRQV